MGTCERLDTYRIPDGAANVALNSNRAERPPEASGKPSTSANPDETAAVAPTSTNTNTPAASASNAATPTPTRADTQAHPTPTQTQAPPTSTSPPPTQTAAPTVPLPTEPQSQGGRRGVTVRSIDGFATFLGLTVATGLVSSNRHDSESIAIEILSQPAGDLLKGAALDLALTKGGDNGAHNVIAEALEPFAYPPQLADELRGSYEPPAWSARLEGLLDGHDYAEPTGTVEFLAPLNREVHRRVRDIARPLTHIGPGVPAFAEEPPPGPGYHRALKYIAWHRGSVPQNP